MLREEELTAKQNNCWYDWKWQLKNKIDSVESLSKYFSMDSKEAYDINLCLNKFRMSITPYYASLIKEFSEKDPIFLQSVPTYHELEQNKNDMLDPLNEGGDSKTPFLVHRYPDRVLFLVTKMCSMYCRHCTRRRLVGERDSIISEVEYQKALNYIREHTEVRDVLISGGDPLVMETSKLEHIIKGIRDISHVEVIRIGTRVPVVLPMRITNELTDMLKKYHPLWINTHFNHPAEITNDSIEACRKIVDAGIPLGNQSVLLKGVNNDASVMKDLLLKLVKARVRPYYLYQCDLSQGISHFRTKVEEGIEIMHSLQGNISGFAIPKFVIDAPGGGGKVPINYNYVKSLNSKEIVFTNFKGKTYHYPEP